jgi:hypothetical protein
MHATALPPCKAYLLLPSYLLYCGKLILWLRFFPLFFFLLGGLCCFLFLSENINRMIVAVSVVRNSEIVYYLWYEIIYISWVALAKK